MNKPKERRRKILFINAVNEVTRERAQSFLEEEHIQKILKTYQDFADVDGFARVATVDEIRANNANLSIPLYVRPTANGSNGKAAAADDKDLKAAIADWQQSSITLRESMDQLFATLSEAGLEH